MSAPKNFRNTRWERLPKILSRGGNTMSRISSQTDKPTRSLAKDMKCRCRSITSPVVDRAVDPDYPRAENRRRSLLAPITIPTPSMVSSQVPGSGVDNDTSANPKNGGSKPEVPTALLTNSSTSFVLVARNENDSSSHAVDMPPLFTIPGEL